MNQSGMLAADIFAADLIAVDIPESLGYVWHWIFTPHPVEFRNTQTKTVQCL